MELFGKENSLLGECFITTRYPKSYLETAVGSEREKDSSKAPNGEVLRTTEYEREYDDGLKELEVVHNNNMTKNKEHISPAEPIEAIRMELNTSTNDVSPHDKGIPPTWLKTELQSTLNEE